MQTTSPTLLVRIRAREDQEAWRRFVNLYTPLLLFWVRRIGISDSDATDLVQDILMHLLDKIPSFERRNLGSFRAWLRTVATNKCHERFRKKSIATDGDPQALESAIAGLESDPFWEQEYRQHVMAQALEVMQRDFEPATWQACWQRVVEGLPASKVANQLGISEAAVHVYTGRVLRRLRQELADMLD